jgi:hypothetical protein
MEQVIWSTVSQGGVCAVLLVVLARWIGTRVTAYETRMQHVVDLLMKENHEQVARCQKMSDDHLISERAHVVELVETTNYHTSVLRNLLKDRPCMMNVAGTHSVTDSGNFEKPQRKGG